MICKRCNFQNEENAKFCKNCGIKLHMTSMSSWNNLPKRSSNVATWVMSALFVLAMIAFIFTWTQYEEMDAAHNRDYLSLQQKFDDLRERFPLIITRIELANTTDSRDIIDNFGNRLYRSRLKFLSPKIYFKNYLKESKTFDFEIRYIDKWGKMEYNHTTGEIPKSKDYISTTDENKLLTGWGNKSGGSWKSGRWTIEIWHDGVCLGSEKFTIY